MEIITTDILTGGVSGSKVLRIYESFILGKCKCCNEDIPIRSKDKALQRYKTKGHYLKHKDQTGEKNPAWKGGQVTTYQGYLNTTRPKDDLFKHMYKPQHRIIYEQHYNCCLLSTTIIHHKNENRKDNRIENLEALTRSQHISLHNKIRYNSVDIDKRTCKICLVKESNKFYRYEDWYICSKCYDKKRRGTI